MNKLKELFQVALDAAVFVAMLGAFWFLLWVLNDVVNGV